LQEEFEHTKDVIRSINQRCTDNTLTKRKRTKGKKKGKSTIYKTYTWN